MQKGLAPVAIDLKILRKGKKAMSKGMSLSMPAIGRKEKGEAVASKVGRNVAVAASMVSFAIRYPYAFFASGFDIPTVNSSTLSQKFGDPNAIMGMVVGLALWICQMVGVGMLIWGIYGYVTARKDGEAEAMNGALGKLISGAVLIGMKGVLTLLGIVS